MTISLIENKGLTGYEEKTEFISWKVGFENSIIARYVWGSGTAYTEYPCVEL